MKTKILNYNLKPEYAPNRKHPIDVGMDVFAHENYFVPAHDTVKIPLHFGVELPVGYAGFVIPRSSMAAKGIVSQSAPIDPGYTGQIHAIVTNYTDYDYQIVEGDRIAQLVVVPVLYVDFYSDDETLSGIKFVARDSDGSARGNGGFGSTGA